MSKQSKEINNILDGLTAIDELLQKLTVMHKTQRLSSTAKQRRRNIQDIRKYLAKHLYVVQTLEEEVNEKDDELRKINKKFLELQQKKEGIQKVDAAKTYEKQIDNLTF